MISDSNLAGSKSVIEIDTEKSNSMIHPRTGALMVRVPQGHFLMGSGGGGEFEAPEHQVVLSEFLLDVTPVTNASFQRFIDDTGFVTAAEEAGEAWGYSDGRFQTVPGLCWRSYATVERFDHPVVLVTWDDAQAYCEWAGLRLPTEAEWERAARGDQRQAEFPWGDALPDGTQSNFAQACSGLPPTKPVMSFGCNSLGIGDLVGNVWQWCADWFGAEYYSCSPTNDPHGPAEGTVRVRRGGSWNVIQAFRLRSSNRGAMSPEKCAPNVGFRAASSAVPSSPTLPIVGK